MTRSWSFDARPTNDSRPSSTPYSPTIHHLAQSRNILVAHPSTDDAMYRVHGRYRLSAWEPLPMGRPGPSLGLPEPSRSSADESGRMTLQLPPLVHLLVASAISGRPSTYATTCSRLPSVPRTPLAPSAAASPTCDGTFASVKVNPLRHDDRCSRPHPSVSHPS